jgi:hypothetical protein
VADESDENDGAGIDEAAGVSFAEPAPGGGGGGGLESVRPDACVREQAPHLRAGGGRRQRG